MKSAHLKGDLLFAKNTFKPKLEIDKNIKGPEDSIESYQPQFNNQVQPEYLNQAISKP
jgi:hypothetical protein